MALDIAGAINCLHKRRKPLIHFDIKSPNILLKRGEAKLADVGLLKMMTRPDGVISSARAEIGTLAWTAPEILIPTEVPDCSVIAPPPPNAPTTFDCIVRHL